MVVIVYSSKSGSSKKYAESLSKAVSLDVYPLGSQPDGETMIFFGWIKGKEVIGLRGVDLRKIQALCVVGLDDCGRFPKTALVNRYGLHMPIYYLRGWIDRSRLNMADKAILMAVCVMMKLKGLNEFNKPVFDAMMAGGSFYDEKYLKPIIEFVKSSQN